MSAIIDTSRQLALAKLRKAIMADSRADHLTYVVGVGGRYLCHIEDQSKYCPHSWEDTHISHFVSDDYQEARDLMLELVFKGPADTAVILDTETDAIIALVGKLGSFRGRLPSSYFIRQSWVGFDDAMANDFAEYSNCPSTFLLNEERSGSWKPS
jgi:hypothetical protein